MTEDQVRVPKKETALARELFTGRRGALRIHVFELVVGLTYVVIGLAFLLDTHKALRFSIVGRDVGEFPHVWGALMILGGVGVLWGLLRPSVIARMASLVILATGLLMFGIAAAVTRADVRAVAPLAFAAACVIRTWGIYQLLRRVGVAGATRSQKQGPL